MPNGRRGRAGPGGQARTGYTGAGCGRAGAFGGPAHGRRREREHRRWVRRRARRKARRSHRGGGAGAETETAEPADEFSAAETFEGRRDGFEFKLGDRGLGYYRTDAAILEAGARAVGQQQGPAGWTPESAGLPTREEQAKWKPLEWERFKEERRQYWGRLKHPMLRKSAAARGLYDGGDVAALRDRMLKSVLGLGLTDWIRTAGPAAGLQAAASDNLGDTTADTPADSAPTDSATVCEPYVPQPGEQCYTVGCQQACDVSKECPVCLTRHADILLRTTASRRIGRRTRNCIASLMTHLDTIQSWGLSRPMAAEILMSTDVGSITAVAAMANTNELVAIMALHKNDFDVGQAVMHLSGRDSEKRMDLPTQDEAMNRVLERLK